MVPEAQDTKAHLLDVGLSPEICIILRVLATIELNDQTLIDAGEIDDV